MENQIELNNERLRLADKFRAALPSFTDPQAAMTEATYKDGALSKKVKLLMALAIALRAGCTNCIVAHAVRALEAGVSKDEILETLSVVVLMSGKTGIGESLRVIKLLEDMGKL
jgi:AhpD family alkylhydroperoxidase